MPTVNVGGVNIFYDPGESEPGREQKIVLVHGAGGNSSRWRHQVKALAGDYSPFALDLPGHGLSGGQPCDQVFLYREWVKQFADSLGLKKFVLAGHSMGGAIALDFALTYQSCLAGLILVSTGAKLKVDPARLESYRNGEFRAEWARMSYSPAAPPELVERGVEEATALDPAVRYTDFLACDRFDVMSRLGDIVTPTLVICGLDDLATPVNYSRYLAENIAGAKLLLLPGTAHMAMLEQPQAVNEAIFNFLRAL
jgi:pimeloyl-ACP methyl ester carboxylesterase